MKTKIYGSLFCCALAACLLASGLSHAQSTTQNYTTKEVMRSASSGMVSVTYYDGLGRPVQQVEKGATPTGYDIVTPIEYDVMGRDNVKQHLPYTTSTSTGIYQASAVSDKTSFYTSRFSSAEAARSFSENKYEASPLNRVTESYRPGKDYSAKKMTYVYGKNTTTTEVRRLTLSGTGTYTISLANYPSSALNKTTATDEDGTVVYTYTDFRGNVVLERVASDGVTTNIDTYYVYDDRGLLCLVIPPEASSRLNVVGVSSISESNAHVQNYCYIYRYNNRGLVSYKKLPGKVGETCSYTSFDELSVRNVYDAINARESVNLYLYDAHRRVIREQYYPDYRESTSLTAAEYKYDTYEARTGTPSIPSTLAYATVMDVVISRYTNATGLKTYERVAVLDGSAFTTSPVYVERAFYYDHRGRVVQTVERNHLGGISRYSTKYTYSGQVEKLHESHRTSSSGSADTKLTTFTYDTRDRVLAETTSLNGGTSGSVSYTYDNLGMLTTKTYGSVPEIYTYDIRGWLTGQSSSLFQSQLRYHDPGISVYYEQGRELVQSCT